MGKNTELQDITAVLAEVASAVVGQFEMTSLLNNIINKTMETLHAEVCSIFLEDKEKEPGVITCVAGSGFAKEIVGIAKYKSGESLTGSVFKHGVEYNTKSLEEHKNLLINGQRVWEGKFDHTQWPGGGNKFRNGIGIPLKIKDQTLGVIKAENKIEQYGDFFSDEDVKIFKTIANVIALTIENARLHHQIEEQLKTIAAKAAHRINNQVASYDGIELELIDEAESHVANREHLFSLSTRLGETTQNLKSLINDFRNYGKPIILNKTVSNINEVILNEINLAKPHQKVKIEHELDNNIPHFKFDKVRFAESVREMIQNAIRVLSKQVESGKITIVTTLLQGNELDVSISKSCLLTIMDDGPGFPQNFPVFSPFHSTDPQRTGLGLSTVKELIEAHGGLIKIIPRQRGARFEIMVPIE